MRANNFFHKAAIASFMILSGWLLFANCTNVSGSNVFKEKGSGYDANKYKACTLIKSKDIKAAINKSKAKKVILNIYAVKLSNNSTKKDFDLRVVYQDAADRSKSINSKTDKKLLEVQSGWYAGFLKENNVPAGKIPFGYYIEIDTTFLKNSMGLNICLVPGQDVVYYQLLSSKTGESGENSAEEDSTCKCPPDCCQYNILASDSTGKCPPDCTEYLLYKTIVKSAIDKKYRNQ